MKIHFDKINAAPWYPFTPAVMRFVFASIPTEWLSEVGEVHMSNSLMPDARTILIPGKKMLIVYSRDRKQREVIQLILTELAAYFLGYKPHGGFGKITGTQADHIREITKPVVETILANLPLPKPNPLYPAPVRAPWEKHPQSGTLFEKKK